MLTMKCPDPQRSRVKYDCFFAATAIRTQYTGRPLGMQRGASQALPSIQFGHLQKQPSCPVHKGSPLKSTNPKKTKTGCRFLSSRWTFTGHRKGQGGISRSVSGQRRRVGRCPQRSGAGNGHVHGCCWETLFFYMSASCGLVVELQPLNCLNKKCSPSNVNQV